MDGVNNLFQNIRFLKIYGWGMEIFSALDHIINVTNSLKDNHWAQNVQNEREKELKWRAKQTMMQIFTSFLW